MTIFSEKNVSFVIGAHLFNCYKQCGYKNDGVQCVLDISPNNPNGRFPSGKCHILPEPRDSTATDNHVHIMVYVPAIGSDDPLSLTHVSTPVAESGDPRPVVKKQKLDEEDSGAKDFDKMDSTNCHMKPKNKKRVKEDASEKLADVSGAGCGEIPEPPVVREVSVNWRLETVVRHIQDFFAHDLKKKAELGSFSVQQRSVWCPYSVWTSFLPHVTDDYTMIEGPIFKEVMQLEKKKQSLDYATRELFPKRAPKLRAKTIWEFHCTWAHEIEG